MVWALFVTLFGATEEVAVKPWEDFSAWIMFLAMLGRMLFIWRGLLVLL